MDNSLKRMKFSDNNEYVKLTTENFTDNYNKYQYKEGLNCIDEKSDGLYFCRKEDIGIGLYNYEKNVLYLGC